MRDSLRVILITVALFLSGLLVGIWTQKVRPMPPPPFGPMSEFGGQSLPGFPGSAPALPPWMQTSPNLPPPSPEEIRRRMATLEPQFEASERTSMRSNSNSGVPSKRYSIRIRSISSKTSRTALRTCLIHCPAAVR